MPIIPFRIVELEEASFHPLITAIIDGVAINLILDTGASRTVIDKKLVHNHPLIRNENQEAFAAGINAQKMEVEHINLKNLIIGTESFTDMVVFSTDLQPVSSLYEQMAGMKIDGLLGSDFLVKYGAIINYQTCEISIVNTL